LSICIIIIFVDVLTLIHQLCILDYTLTTDKTTNILYKTKVIKYTYISVN